MQLQPSTRSRTCYISNQLKFQVAAPLTTAGGAPRPGRRPRAMAASKDPFSELGEDVEAAPDAPAPRPPFLSGVKNLFRGKCGEEEDEASAAAAWHERHRAGVDALFAAFQQRAATEDGGAAEAFARVPAAAFAALLAARRPRAVAPRLPPRALVVHDGKRRLVASTTKRVRVTRTELRWGNRADGAVALAAVAAVVATAAADRPERATEHCFSVATEARVVVFEADDAATRDAWIDALNGILFAPEPAPEPAPPPAPAPAPPAAAAALPPRAPTTPAKYREELPANGTDKKFRGLRKSVAAATGVHNAFGDKRLTPPRTSGVRGSSPAGARPRSRSPPPRGAS